MDSQQPGPSGLCRPPPTNRNIFRTFLAQDVSDEEDDFDHIAHVSDHEDSDTGSSSYFQMMNFLLDLDLVVIEGQRERVFGSLKLLRI